MPEPADPNQRFGRGPRRDVAGLLLTGGASRRMGRDKASLRFGGVSCARRLAGLLVEVVAPGLEVGPGRSGLEAVLEPTPGSGPLSALAAAWAALEGGGHRGPAVVLATDVPLVTVELLRLLADWPGGGTVVPVVDGRPQPLCARLGAETLAACAGYVAGGHRSLRPVLDEPGVTWLAEDQWSAVATARHFADFDTPEDLARLGLRPDLTDRTS